MTFFTGEYESKLDAKGRLVLPARIKSQLPESGGNEIVIRRGFENCLVIYPMAEFNKVLSKIAALSEFNEEARQLQRNFLPGANIVDLDSHGRFVVTKNLLTYANIDKDVVLVGVGNKVEVWNPSIYEKHLIKDQSELSKLAQKHLEG
jgi:MraZ protein